MRTWRDRLSGVVAASALVALIAGVPLFLVQVFGWPLPHDIVTWSQLDRPTLTDEAPVDAAVLLLWAGWAWFVAALAVQIRAQIRSDSQRLPTRGVAKLAYQLVTTALLLVPVSHQTMQAAASVSTISAVTALPVSYQGEPVDSAQRTMTIKPGDTLWDIAESELGSGLRWRELLAANPHLPQNQRELSVGMKIALPDDGSSSAVTGDTYIVQAGDTLTDIARVKLGDAARFSEVFELNRGTSRGGIALTNPDLIRPGMQLRLPPARDMSVGRTPAQSPAGQDPPMSQSTVTVPEELQPPPQNTNVEPLATTTTLPASEPDASNAGSGTRHSSPRPNYAPEVLAGTALMLAGVVGWLGWLRHRQIQEFRPGNRLPRPSHQTAETESKIRAIADDRAVEWVDLSLRVLAADLRLAGNCAMPRIERISAGLFGVELVLVEPMLPAPKHFEAVEHGAIWRLCSDVDLSEASAIDESSALSALLILGSTSEGVQLLNLDEVKILSVDGPDELVQAFLYGAVLSLSTAPWVQRDRMALNEVLATGVNDEIGCLPNILRIPAVDLAIEELASDLDERVDIANDKGWQSLTSARLFDDNDCWATRVMVSATELPESPEFVEVFEQIKHRNAPAAIVTAGRCSATPWHLRLRNDGSAWLDPIGIELVGACVLSSAEQLDVADILSTASAPLDAAESDGVVDLRPVAAEERVVDVDTLIACSGEVGVRVLGNVVPFGFRWNDRTRAATNTAVLVRLVMHRQITGCSAAPTFAVLKQDLWASETLLGQVKDDSVRSAVSHVRRSLGTAADGQPYLAPSSLQLHADLWCDLDHFDELVKASEWVSSNDAIRLLEAAVDLIRGAPFGDAEALPRYSWIHKNYLLSTIASRVITAVCKLASLAEDTGDDELVRKAVRQGLKVEPGNHELHAHLMRAAAKNQSELERVWADYQRYCEATGQDVQSETLAIYRDMREGSRQTARLVAHGSK